MSHRTFAFAAALVPMFVTMSANEVRAGGFQITELCAKCQGYRNAGAAASSREPATVYFNPAGIAFLPFADDDKNIVDLSTHYISGKFKFNNKDSLKALDGVPGSPGTPPTPPTTLNPGGPAEGQQNKDGAKDALVPNFYYARKINEQWGVGLSINVPYGLVTEYDSKWVGRYAANKSDLKTYNINPAVSFKFNDNVSLGLGFNALYADVELTNALDVGSVLWGISPTIGQVSGLTPSSIGSDGKAKLTGNDWGFGWNAGVIFNLNEDRTRLGLSYRSKVKTTLDGKIRIDFPNNDFINGLVGKSSKQDAKADLELPATFNLGLSHDFTEKWRVLAGATWTNWSSFEDITIKLDEGGKIVIPENWDDSWRYQLGTEFEYNDRWTFRTGVEWDESPVPGKYRTARIPDEDRFWLAFGFTFRPWKSEDLSIDFAYTHIFMDDYDINETEVLTEQSGALIGDSLPISSDVIEQNLKGVGNSLKGEYEANANILSLGVRWRF